MLENLDVGAVLSFVERHGYALLFFWVLSEQIAIPLPSFPLLLAAGALIRAGRLSPVPAIACCLLAALIADTVWFELGRRRGRQVLGLFCRVSLEPDSCVRQTENVFLRYGLGSLLISKFIPGLNTVAAPLAGASRVRYARFALYDVAGTLIWCGVIFQIGWLFSQQLKTIAVSASRASSNIVLFVIAAFALWIGWKYGQRRWFLHKLRVDRITPAQLQHRLHAGEDLLMIDLRNGLVDEPALIPGAMRLSPADLAAQLGQLPRNREIVLVCS
ncbi:MAG TPA: VTT domain-containing protein [Bryobacteraceae bacterium]|nr:VTT domain-containing protein [Bryobacteraceae bacterium]